MPKRILIVEENDLHGRFFNDVLETTECETLVSQAGVDAAGPAVTTMPDLILMDMGLPDADGLTTTRRTKADIRARDIPVIAVTACVTAGDAQRAIAGG